MSDRYDPQRARKSSRGSYSKSRSRSRSRSYGSSNVSSEKPAKNNDVHLWQKGHKQKLRSYMQDEVQAMAYPSTPMGEFLVKSGTRRHRKSKRSIRPYIRKKKPQSGLHTQKGIKIPGLTILDTAAKKRLSKMRTITDMRRQRKQETAERIRMAQMERER
eukprot:6195896-Pleurochrysis_carterae.AAC.1